MIEVKPSVTVVKNYKLGDCPTIERYLTVGRMLSNGHFIPNYTLYNYNEDEEELYIPRGYSLPRLSYILKDDEKISYSNACNSSTRISLKCMIPPRDDEQIEAIKFLLEQVPYHEPMYSSQKYLSLKTGKGKTYCMIHAICSLSRRAIIIVDSLNIANQWQEAFLNYTNIKEEDIALLSGKDSVSKVLEDKKYGPSQKIYIALHQTLDSISKANPKILTNLFKKLKVGIKVYDEAHASWSNIFMIDAYTDVEKTFYLSATPGRSDPHENRLYNYCFEKTPMYGRLDTDLEPSKSSYSRYQAEEIDKEEAYHKIYYIKYNSNPTATQQISMIKRNQFDLATYYKYVSEYAFTKFIDSIKTILNICIQQNTGRRIAIIIGKNELIQRVYDELVPIYTNYSIGRFCGLVKTKDKDAEKEKDIVLSTEKSLGKAINVENIGFLINTVPYSSSIISEQMLGRLRKNAKYSFLFDIADIGFQNCKNNQTYRGRTYHRLALSERTIELNL